MRLTLRTLLSYLDDTLDPVEAKLIGEKVAESDIAPQLIERIKKVTRRRGLAAPPVIGDGEESSEPNTVAEYLDNTLPPDQLAEVEQSALDSDAHLAEIAACHQILTLVLGEPAKVPPTARQRMYRLVKGRESIPYRKPTPAWSAVGLADPTQPDDNAEADETLLLGMSNTRLLVPLAGSLVIVSLLIAVIWMAIPAPLPVSANGYVSVPRDVRTVREPNIEPKPVVLKEKKPDRDATKDKTTETIAKVKPKADTEKKKDSVAVKVEPAELLPSPRLLVGPLDKPDLERRPIAKYEDKDTILVQRLRDMSNWDRVVGGKSVNSADTLMALPGNRCNLLLNDKLRIILWGSLPQFHSIPVLDIQESKVNFHVPPMGFDADFTLLSGRVVLTRPPSKGMPVEPAKVRIRFKDEVWDVTLLDRETEVCVDLLGFYAEGIPFSSESGGPAPKSEFYFALLKGRAGLKVRFKEFPMVSAPMRLNWDSDVGAIGTPTKIPPADMEWWNLTVPDHPAAKQMKQAIAHFAQGLSTPDDAQIEVVFFSAMQDVREEPNRRAYAVHCLQALDAIEYLADAIGDDYFIVRTIGIRVLQHWTGLAPDRDLKFYKVLIDKKSYTEEQAKAVMQLTHPLSPVDQRKPEIIAALFDALGHEKIAVRELAYFQLSFIDPAAEKDVGFFDAGAPENVRNGQIQKWKASWKRRFIDKKK